MNKDSYYNMGTPAISARKEFLTQPVEGLSDDHHKQLFTAEYYAFIMGKIWDDCHYTIDDMISGKDIHNANHLAACAFTLLRQRLHEILDHNEALVIQLIEDCSHRLVLLESEIERHIKGNILTSSEYLRVKRSASVIRIICLTVHSSFEIMEEENSRDSSNHPLNSQTGSKLKKIMIMSNRVDKHMDTILESVKQENLRSETSVWFIAATILFFIVFYMDSFFAQDREA